MKLSTLIKPVILTAALALPMLTACSPAPKTFDWKEEIQLQDGRKIIVDRTDVLGGWAEPGQTGTAQKRTIRFTDPSNPNRKFEHSITGSSNYVLLDFDAGMPWLVIYSGPFNNHSQCPIDTYEILALDNGQWKMRALVDKPAKMANYNMLASYASDRYRTGDIRKQNQILQWDIVAQVLQDKRLPPTYDMRWKFVSIQDGRDTDCYAILQKKPLLSNTTSTEVKK